MTEVHQLHVVPDVEDQLDYDSDLKGSDENCCPSYVPWICFGIFAILTLVFIILYALAKSEANDQEVKTPGHVNHSIKQPTNVSFQFMTPDALKADGIDYTLQASGNEQTGLTIDKIGTARMKKDNAKGFVLHTSSDEKLFKSVMTPGHKAANFRSALHSFVLQAKDLGKDATDDTKDKAKDMTIAIAYENKDILQVIYEWLEEAETKKMIKKVIIYKEITAKARGCGPIEYYNFAKQIEPRSGDDNFNELVSNKNLVEKMKNVYTTAYANIETLDAYYKAFNNWTQAGKHAAESGSSLKHEDMNNMRNKIKKKYDEIEKQRDEKKKESDYETKVAKIEDELAKLSKALVDAYTKKAPETQK